MTTAFAGLRRSPQNSAATAAAGCRRQSDLAQFVGQAALDQPCLVSIPNGSFELRAATPMYYAGRSPPQRFDAGATSPSVLQCCACPKRIPPARSLAYEAAAPTNNWSADNQAEP